MPPGSPSRRTVAAFRDGKRLSKYNIASSSSAVLSSPDIDAEGGEDYAKLAKIAGVAGVAFLTIRAELPRIVASAKLPVGELASQGGGAVVSLALRVGLVLLALAGADWLYQRWQHRQDLMMTRRELADEVKQTQGDAEVRRRHRELQAAATADCGQVHADQGGNDG